MRRRRIAKREMTPDVKYNSELVARLINTIMRNGKKSVAQKIVYSAFDVIKAKKKDMDAIYLGDITHIIANTYDKENFGKAGILVYIIAFT